MVGEGQSDGRGIPHSDGEREMDSRSQGRRHLPQECSVGQWSWQIVPEALQGGQLKDEGKQRMYFTSDRWKPAASQRAAGGVTSLLAPGHSEAFREEVLWFLFLFPG